MINITLKGGEIRQFEQGTTVAEVAKALGSGLYKAACCGEVDGETRDLRYPLERDCALSICTFEQEAGKRAGSQMLIANAVNMRTDVLISCGVLVGLFFTFVLEMPVLDTVTGLIVSVFILRSAVEIFLRSNVELMDGVDDPQIYNRIFDAVALVPEAGNPHRVRSRQIGGHYMIVLDVEVDGSMTVADAHEIAHRVEVCIRSAVENIYDIVVHVEPAGCCHEDEPFGIEPD